MGAFTKSILILLIAVSTPLIYRQFANEKTVKFMSAYYSNYKSIDQFLRQSAGHIDNAKAYLPNSDELKSYAIKINQQVGDLIQQAKSRVGDAEPKLAQDETKSGEQKFRVVKCPNEDLSGQNIRLWSKDELAKYNGDSSEPKVYLGFMGLVYDVTVNAQHYAKGADYNAFAGRDATRAFVTGNFTHDLNDNIADIDESMYSHIESWASFYGSSYPVLGRIEGRFFDSNGCGTQELARVKKVFNKLEQEKAKQKEHEADFPDCNSEWNGDLKKGRVWCTTKSGGVERNWIGVPRIYNDGGSQKCVCLNQEDPTTADLGKTMGVYPGCDASASECPLSQ